MNLMNTSFFCFVFGLILFMVVGDLKIRIFEVTSIPTCRQSWCGWVQSENYDDATALYTMELSDDNELIVNDIKDLRDNGIVDDADVERLTRTYNLNILLENATTPLQLNFPGTKSIADVKNDVYAVTNIAVRHQKWHGWPSGVSDNTALALSGIPFEHNLVLNSTETTSTNQTKPNASQPNAETSNARSNHNNEPIEVDSDSSVDEFEDASDFNGDDEIFAAPSANRRRNDLSSYIIFN